MTATALSVSEVFAHALQGEACYLTGFSSVPIRLPVDEWARRPDDADRALVGLCAGPTLDIGCGPGRLTAELAAAGHVTLGIDLVEEAVCQTRSRGCAALRRSVFEPVPGEGRWHTALLADGNVGIGGDPALLLQRVRHLLAPGGRAVVEVSAPGVRGRRVQARLACPCATSEVFPWSVVGLADMPALAAAAGFTVAGVRALGDRWATVLVERA